MSRKRDLDLEEWAQVIDGMTECERLLGVVVGLLRETDTAWDVDRLNAFQRKLPYLRANAESDRARQHPDSA